MEESSLKRDSKKTQLNRSDLACIVVCRLVLGSVSREQYTTALVQVGHGSDAIVQMRFLSAPASTLGLCSPSLLGEGMPRIIFFGKGLAEPVSLLTRTCLVVTCEPTFKK